MKAYKGRVRTEFTAMVRFYKRFSIIDSGCWEWNGAKSSNGYSNFSVNRKSGPAHRYSYELFVNKIGDGLTIDHLCKNKICVNPVHLEVVTFEENLNRREPVGKNKKSECINGHAYTEENRYINRSGYQVCRKCNREHNKRQYYKNKSKL